MKKNKLSIRLINQLRYRDIFSYFSIKYLYLNSLAQKDDWAVKIAKHLVLNNASLSYFPISNFKEIDGNGKILHRQIFIPTSVESIAEAVLIEECSKHSSFDLLPCVYSYRQASKEETNGVYEPYYIGLKQRHKEIALNCRNNKEHFVYFFDIKKFYPNIKIDKAVEAWNNCCESSSIDVEYKKLGLKLLENHARANKELGFSDGMLTGPLFSHLIANIILKETDSVLYKKFGKRYLRYVDDITLIGTINEIEDGKKIIEEMISLLGLELHPESSDKNISVTAEEWLTSERDYDDMLSTKWMFFIGNLKRYLVFSPRNHDQLNDEFLRRKIRLPLKIYIENAKKNEYIEKIKKSILKYKEWYILKLKSINVNSLVNEALEIKRDFLHALNKVIDEVDLDNKFQRKRAVSKIRFLLGRLFYLLDEDELLSISERIEGIEELKMHYEMLLSFSSGDVSKIIAMGSNVSQSAAQILKIYGKKVKIDINNEIDAVSRQGLAIFRANQIEIEGPDDDELNIFFKQGCLNNELLLSKNNFIKEIASLHGVSDKPRHEDLIKIALDKNEELFFDLTNPFNTY